jgi:hypothetical protein
MSITINSFLPSTLINETALRLSDKNKRHIYDYIKKSHCRDLDSEGEVFFVTRDPSLTGNNETSNVKVTFELSGYTYLNRESHESTDFYVNFADVDLFGFYGGPLFAQDEIQVCEHPLLAHIREKYKGRVFTQNSNGDPTPVLIMNVPRLASVGNSEYPLYGNKFSKVSTDYLENATTILTNDTLKNRGLSPSSNIICMSAKYNNGVYSREDISYTFNAAYLGFYLCRLNSPYLTCIHTGNWGCGAFGGNVVLMTAIQILASRLAGINKLVYHSMTLDSQLKAKEGLKVAESLWGDSENPKGGVGTIFKNRNDNAQRVFETEKEMLISKLVSLKYSWGVSNGT